MSDLNERLFNTGAVEINYAEGPDNGSPLVLIHGLASRWQNWYSVIPLLMSD